MRINSICRQPESRFLPTGVCHATLLLGLTAFFCGCTAPMVSKTYNITVTQYGIGPNSVASDVLKETDVAPQLKASLK